MRRQESKIFQAIIAPPIALLVLLTAFGGLALGEGAALAAPLWAAAAAVNLAAMILIGLPVHLLLTKQKAATTPNYTMLGFIGGAVVGSAISKLGIPIGNGTAPAFGALAAVIAFSGGVWGFISAMIASKIIISKRAEQS